MKRAKKCEFFREKGCGIVHKIGKMILFNPMIFQLTS